MTLPTNVVPGQSGAIADFNEAFTSINLLVAAHDPATGKAVRVTRPLTTDRLVEVWNGSAWSVVDYNSGWRDVSGLLANGWTGTVHLLREGNRCTLRMKTIDAPGGQSTFIGLPAGFYADSYCALGVGGDSNGTLARIASDGGVNVIAITAGGTQYTAAQYVFAEVSWVTSSAIPTSLPGTLVSAAPA